MAKGGYVDQLKAQRAMKRLQEAEAQRISTLEPPDPSRMVMQSDWILIRRTPKDRTEGGIVLPEGSSAASPADGVIVAMGKGQYVAGEKGLTLLPLECKVGDEVMLDPQAPAYGMPADRTLFATRAVYIMAILQPKTPLLDA
jgi:co-chaperonin GroES (HSP10)